MSNIMINDIVGTVAFAIPTNDAALITANQAFAEVLGDIPGVAGLVFERVLAWVKDSGGPGGAEGVRTLSCLIAGVTYNGEECPDETECDALFAAISAALLGTEGLITSVGSQEFNIVNYFPID